MRIHVQQNRLPRWQATEVRCRQDDVSRSPTKGELTKYVEPNRMSHLVQLVKYLRAIRSDESEDPYCFDMCKQGYSLRIVEDANGFCPTEEQIQTDSGELERCDWPDRFRRPIRLTWSDSIGRIDPT